MVDNAQACRSVVSQTRGSDCSSIAAFAQRDSKYAYATKMRRSRASAAIGVSRVGPCLAVALIFVGCGGASRAEREAAAVRNVAERYIRALVRGDYVTAFESL